MNHTIRRIVTALLLASTMLSFAACGEAAPAGTTASDNGSQTSASKEETTTEEETTKYYDPGLPEMDFGGRTATWLVKGEAYGVNWISHEIWVESLNGEVVNDAVYNRNLKLEEKYNFDIQAVFASSIPSQARNDIASGNGQFDVVMPNTSESATLAREGVLFDLYDVPYIDVSQEWWDHNAVRDLSIANHLWFCDGEINYQDNDATWVVMFNKDIIGDYDIDDPYQVVRDDKWTTDVLLDMTSDVSTDLDGDGEMGYDDMWGMVTAYTTVNSMIYAANIKIVSKDENDLPYLTFNTDRTQTVLEKAIAIMEEDNRSFVTNHFSGKGYDAFTMREVFGGGRGLFYGEVLMHVKTMRWSEVTFGVVPFPKYDESIEGYPHFIHATATMVAIPLTTPDPEFTGLMTEAMAAESMNTLTPAYYDVALTGKYMRDNESAEMLDLIIDSRVYDLGHIYAWGGLSDGFVSLVQKKSTDFSSFYESKAPSAQAAIDKFLEGLN